MIKTTAEIDQKLREDFHRSLKEYGADGPSTDPILAVMFRSFAARIQSIYGETDQIRSSLLNELVDGLGFARRFAVPAQTIASYRLESDKPVELPAGIQLKAVGDGTAVLTFCADYGIRVSSARVAMVLTYQDGILRVLNDGNLPDSVALAGPRFDPFPCSLGPYPALFVAIDDIPDSHLARHGLYFHLDPDATRLKAALPKEHWCLADSDGLFSGFGVMRPGNLNGGQIQLNWLGQVSPKEHTETKGDLIELHAGYWSGRCFRMPTAIERNKHICVSPKALRHALSSLFERPGVMADTPRAWIRIQFGTDVEQLATAVRSVHLNCHSASNIECLNQTIRFSSDGQTVPLEKHEAMGLMLVAPLSIIGESGVEYAPEFEPSLDPLAGRYKFGQGNITFSPGRRKDGGFDRYVNLRTWMTPGKAGNRLAPGALTAFSATLASRVLPTNLTSGAGGADVEQYNNSRDRFALALAARERLITAHDIVLACRAYDRRIVGAGVRVVLARDIAGLARTYEVSVAMDRQAFTDPSWEGVALVTGLEKFLQERTPLDIRAKVVIEWRSQVDG